MLGGRYAVADAATGILVPGLSIELASTGLWGAASPLLKEEGEIGAPAGVSDVPSPIGSMGRAPGPLSPPTITQEMPVRSRSTGPSSGSMERKLLCTKEAADRATRESIGVDLHGLVNVS